MNKRYEKYINKKNETKNNKNSKTILAPYKYTYSFNIKNNNSKLSKLSSKTLNLEQKNYTNIFRNIKHKNTYIGFFNKKGKFKLQQGMFSYKLSTNSNFNNSVESNNSIERHNSSMISNKLNSINLSNKIQKEKENHNTLFPNLKLFLDNAEISSIKTVVTNNDNNISNQQFHNHSAMNLNKYKIITNNNIIHKQNKSMDFANINNNNIFNNMNYNYDFLKYSNIIINNINQSNIKLNSEDINLKPKQEIKFTSNLMQFINKPKIEKEKEKNKNKKNVLIMNYFLFKPKEEKESRRMIIEYLKVLKRLEKNKYKLTNILNSQNISDKVLNQQTINTNLNIYTLNTKNSKFFYQKSKKIESPGESANLKNITKFLKDMNDITKDKISMVKYLSIPHIMDLIFLEKKYKFIFMLRPNLLSYIKGFESYIFQWADIKTKKTVGGFDLIKINSCCINYKENKNILIETFDGEYHREYELITESKNSAENFVKSINYLSRLEKCKIYNKNISNFE